MTASIQLFSKKDKHPMVLEMNLDDIESIRIEGFKKDRQIPTERVLWLIRNEEYQK